MTFRLNRRGVLAAGLPAAFPSFLALAEVTKADPERRLVFVPQMMPHSLDPIANPSLATCTAAMAIFETLYGLDARLNTVPQMIQAHRMENDGKLWTLDLRPGLLFHDGKPVTARDCVASLRRWMRRDPCGMALAARLAGIEASNEQTIILRLTKSQIELPRMLTKSLVSPPVIMPAFLAESTSPTVAVNPLIGSGPFRLERDSWRPGVTLDLVRFPSYTPRLEESNFLAGRRVASIDRVMWRGFDDPVQALRDGRADWVELLAPDLADDAIGDPACNVARLDETGYYAMLRLNPTQTATAHPRIRQAILAAIDPTAVMEAVFGVDSPKFTPAAGLFSIASGFANDTGIDKTGARKSTRAIVAMLKDAGYKGEALILLNPSDDKIHAGMTASVSEQLRRIGVVIQERTLDGRAFEAWRLQTNTPGSSGGDWSMACDSTPAADRSDPLAWSTGDSDPAVNSLRDAWIDTSDPRARRTLATRLQDLAFNSAFFVPLGVWRPTSAWRSTLRGLQEGAFPVFWGVARGDATR